VRQCHAQATSQQHFLELLRTNDLHRYELNGVATDIEYKGVKLRFSRLLEKGQFESFPIDRSEHNAALLNIQYIRKKQ
jgi:hypothetical protein